MTLVFSHPSSLRLLRLGSGRSEPTCTTRTYIRCSWASAAAESISPADVSVSN